MIRIKKELLFVLLLCVFSCKTNVENTNSEKAKTEKANMEISKFKVIAKGNLYGSGAEGIDAQNLIITNQKDWDKLMNQMNSVNQVSDGFSEITFNFSEDTIIAVFDDVKGSGGHRLELSHASNSENTIVYIKHIAPKGMATSVMTQPYYIISIPKSDLPIKFLSAL